MMESTLDLAGIYSLLDSGGDDSLLTDEERAQLPASKRAGGHFGANLAETLDENTLNSIAQDVYDGYESDEESRADWRKREKLGIRLLGISENADSEPAFDGASQAVFPGLMEAVIQFQARAMAELWQAEGPAKAITEGDDINPQRELQAQRVARYLNWLYTTKMPSGYSHHDRMLFRLPLSGSVFKKVYFDPRPGCMVSRYVPAEYLIVPYGTEDLATTPRVTHLLRYTGHTIEQMMETGTYRTVDLAHMTDETEPTDLQPELDAVTSTKPSMQHIERSERYVCLEQSVFLDIDGEPKNSPFLVTIERESREVLAVYRDWREGDATRQRRKRFIHYYFFPGIDGFYGLGFLHILGRLAESQSGNLRALLDAGTLANLRGGFRSSDVRLTKGNAKDGITIKPGEWKPVDATTEELQKLFVSIPYGEPSQTLFNLLQWLDEVVRRISGTTSELIGESSKAVPVGTTLARIEQGMKVQTQIQIRCHQTQAEELALACEVIADTFPDERYCRDVLGLDPAAFAADFDGRVDIRPVSDPNAVTGAQRLFIAQALIDRAQQAPDLYDRREVERRFLEVLRVGQIDALLPDQSQAERMGPVEENMALVMQRPVRAYPDQDHLAHRIVHRQWLESLDPETRKRVEPAAIAHEAEHQAWAYHLQMQQVLGGQLPAAPMGQPGNLDPATENMLAMMAAQAVQLMSQQQPAAVDPAAMQAASKAEAEHAKASADIRRKDAIAAAQINRDDQQAIARMNRDTAEAEARLIGKYLSEPAKQALGEPQ